VGRSTCVRQGNAIHILIAYSFFEVCQLLHLHPLTLEDILQQEPREKLELFPKLGYYFVSFRAIESKETREKVRRTAWKNSDSADYVDDEPVGEANVYLAVFKEGICCVS
jgi:magnesium transporter